MLKKDFPALSEEFGPTEAQIVNHYKNNSEAGGSGNSATLGFGVVDQSADDDSGKFENEEKPLDLNAGDDDDDDDDEEN